MPYRNYFNDDTSTKWSWDTDDWSLTANGKKKEMLHDSRKIPISAVVRPFLCDGAPRTSWPDQPLVWSLSSLTRPRTLYTYEFPKGPSRPWCLTRTCSSRGQKFSPKNLLQCLTTISICLTTIFMCFTTTVDDQTTNVICTGPTSYCFC
jgi:hypothetical protein